MRLESGKHKSKGFGEIAPRLPVSRLWAGKELREACLLRVGCLQKFGTLDRDTKISLRKKEKKIVWWKI